MIDKKNMMNHVYSQLAIDYNCSPDDFKKEGLIFTEAKENVGRRPFPCITPRLEMISFGNSVVINASADIMPYVRRQFEGKTRDEVFWSPFVYGVSPYFLPDIGNIAMLNKPDEFEYEIIEKQNIQKLFEMSGLFFDSTSPFVPVLIAVAVNRNGIVGMARASADCKAMWQIDIDVLSPYRRKGVATALVNMLTFEILERGNIPYYFTSNSNVISMRTAVRAGYIPTWVHCYKIRLNDLIK